jgi:tetratricopeptide (TPR) repeat protein
VGAGLPVRGLAPFQFDGPIFDEALTQARQALTALDSPWIRAVPIMVALARGDYAAAESEIADLETDYPQEAQTAYLRALLAYLQGQTEAALQSLREYYERMQDLPPGEGVATPEAVLPGFDRLAQGDSAGAEQAWRAAANEAPGDGTPLFCIALLCEREGRYTDALAAFREGLVREEDKTALTQQFRRVVGRRLGEKSDGEPQTTGPQTTGPQTPPLLVVLKPAGVEGGRDIEVLAPAPKVEIVGVVSDADGVASVMVNGQEVALAAAPAEDLAALPEAARPGAMRFAQEVNVPAPQTVVRLVAVESTHLLTSLLTSSLK